jgi:uncharacterized protein (TIGR02246 family)
MKKSIAGLSALFVIGVAAESWAGPAEEVAQIAAPRTQVFEEGTADAYSAVFADNAVLTSSLSAFRVEGKEAIRAYFAELFQLYPKRRLLVRQPATRAYNEDLVAQNSYSVLYLTDQKGQLIALQIRSSVIWGKISGRWQIVDQHVSRLPEVPHAR